MSEIAVFEITANERPRSPQTIQNTPITFKIERSEVTRPIGTREAINLILTGWKMLVGVPTQGRLSQAWDQVHFSENSVYAYKLLLLFGSWEDAVRAMEYVYQWHKQRNLFASLKAVVRNSDLFREQLG